MIKFTDLQQTIATRKKQLGIVDTPAMTEALRNKGGNRTPEKRESLRQADARALAAGRTAVQAYY